MFDFGFVVEFIIKIWLQFWNTPVMIWGYYLYPFKLFVFGVLLIALRNYLLYIFDF